ncbi:MAG: SIR2 family protein [Gammaproteobacteria bacterium]|nr:SIR2 family protein [Gammaproteobacteria bacterium]
MNYHYDIKEWKTGLCIVHSEEPRKLFILGAGFSNPAGLPLGKELLNQIINIVNSEKETIFDEYKGLFNAHLDNYIKYRQIKIADINIEDFIEFIDYENFLNFFGELGDSRGNNQDIIRFLIAKCLSEKQKEIKESDLYNQFVSELNENDIIISLNYDTILESLFKKFKKQYHLFPSEYLGKYEINMKPPKSTMLLKVHGSINWFDYNEYSQLLEKDGNYRLSLSAISRLPSDFVFNNQHDKPNELTPLIPYGFKPDRETRLQDIYSISMDDLDRYVKAFNTPFERQNNKLPNALMHPVILSPAHSKLLYSNPIKDLFHGAYFYGRDISKIIIIGCGLPDYDRYIRQWIYGIKTKYFGMYKAKSNILVINYAETDSDKKSIKNNYSFLNNKNIDFVYDGFSISCLSKIFSE